MKIPALLTVLLAALLAALPTRHVQAEEVSFDVFYNSLADDGDWYNTPEFGYVWHPAIAEGDKWRPYTDGYWAQTDDGWTWVSYESFGWAAYHYGRWTRLKDIGWAWVPGYQWGPGWVSWRTSNDYVGWAPLPPRADRTAATVTVEYNDVEAPDDGYTQSVDQDFDIGPDNYCFVETRRFGAPVLSEVILPPARNLVIVENTVNVTNIFYRRGPERTVVYNNGPDFAFISGRVEHPIQRLRIERRDDVGYLRDSSRGGGNPTVVHNGVLLVAAPVIARRPVNFEQVKPVRIKQSITETKVVHGWTAAGGDPAQVQRLRERIKVEAQAAPRQARADLPPQNVGPVPEVKDRPAAAAPAPTTPPVDDAQRTARRDAAQRERAARNQARANSQNAAAPSAPATQPATPAQPAQAAQERAPRKAKPVQAAQAPTPARPDPARDNQEVERLLQQQQQAQQTQQAQQDRQAQQQAREARRAERQQPQQAAQPAAQPAQPDREARRAERQSQPAAQPQPAQPDREARRAERQQQAQQAQQAQAQQAQAQQAEAQHAQAQQERAGRRAERQAQPQAPQASEDDKKKKHDN